jgi:isocitrate dehydrogenase
MADLVTLSADGKLQVPHIVAIPFIEGDGVGPDIWQAAHPIFDAAVALAYGGRRAIEWRELSAGQKAYEKTGMGLPLETIDQLRLCKVGIKGPITTPVGCGFRSLNVTLRRELDVYACIRPVKYIPGVPSPVREPEKVDMVVFRENTEDVYTGIEWPAESPEAKKVIHFLDREMHQTLRSDSAIGIKPMSAFGSKRVVRRAIQWAIDHGRKSVTLVHKGNIMKFTEGAFREWGYAVAREEFADVTIPEVELASKGQEPEGKIVVKDRIADAMFQQILLRPEEYDVLALPNLNGDYLSDALAAQVGGLGMAPGGNLGDEIAIFEATHGTAPKYAGQDVINPGSVVLSGAFMFDYLGWHEAASLIRAGLEQTIRDKIVTYDLARRMPDAHRVRCSEFGKAIVTRMETL